MSLLEKWRYFKNGQVLPKTTLTMQQFFKTEITEEQLMLIDKMNREYDKTRNTLFGICLLIYLIMGIFLGAVLTMGAMM